MVQTDNYQSISVAVEYNQTGENTVSVSSNTTTAALIIDYAKLRTTSIQSNMSGGGGNAFIYATTKRGASDKFYDDEYSLIVNRTLTSGTTDSYNLTGNYTKVIVIGISDSGVKTLKCWYKGKN